MLFLASKSWAQEVCRQFDGTYITEPAQYDKGFSDVRLGEKVFSLHWHWKMPDWIVNNHYVVGFHSADLPKFRGGSPIQNQLKAGITRTKITAFKVTERFDAGPILLKRDLSLDSNTDIMYNRLRNIVPEMIQQILDGNYVETPQDETQATFVTRADAF